MRSFTSSSRYLFLFLAALSVPLGATYTNLLVYSLEARDSYAGEIVKSEDYFKKLTPESTVIFRGDCLVENVVAFDRLGISDLVVTRDDAPWEFVDYLNRVPRTPKRILVTEDTTAFLFYKERKATQVPYTTDPKTFVGYENKLFTKARAEEEAFLGKIREGSESSSPVFLRERISMMLDRYAKMIVPLQEARDPVPILWFWLGNLKFYFTGDQITMLMAYNHHRSFFFLPSVRDWLIKRFFRFDRMFNAPVPKNWNPRRYFLAGDYPRTAAEEENYPAIVALKAAEKKGSQISIVILPSNPNTETVQVPVVAPFYAAMREVALRSGWPFKDLRTIMTPELGKFGNFSDAVHPWHMKDDRYLDLVVRLLKNEIEHPIR